jgi:hypothetical protein
VKDNRQTADDHVPHPALLELAEDRAECAHPATIPCRPRAGTKSRGVDAGRRAR